MNPTIRHPDARSRLAVREDVVFRPVKDGGIVVDLQSGASFEVNRLGAEVWMLLSAGSTVTEIADTISRKYGAPPETVGADVRAVCADMLAAGLVTEQRDTRA